MKKLKKWNVVVSQNGWEYAGLVIIRAKKINRISGTKNAIMADGVYIEFNEEIKLNAKLGNYGL